MLAEVCQLFSFHDLCRRLHSHPSRFLRGHFTPHTGTVHWAARWTSTNSTKFGATNVEDDDDPVVLLRRVQKDFVDREVQGKEQMSPALKRQCGKGAPKMSSNISAARISTQKAPSKITEDDAKGAPKCCVNPSLSEHNASDDSLRRNEDVGSQKSAATARNPFIERLSQMEVKSRLASLPTYDAATDARRLKIQQKVREERKRMLVFRNVGMDLDKPILSRDVFLIFKYFYYGVEFAIDNKLERMLRYFNEDALNELKIIEDSKLMRGPSTLSRRQKPGPRHPPSVFSRPGDYATWAPDANPTGLHLDNPAKFDSGPRASHTRAGSADLPLLLTTFPNVSCANVRQFCRGFDARIYQALRDVLRPNPLQSLFCGFFPIASTDTSTARDAPKKFSEKNASLFITLSAASFRRPALVIYSQLGQKFGSTADAMWRRLAYRTICPALVEYMPEEEEQNTGAGAATKDPLKRKVQSTMMAHRSMPIDVVSLRSVDLHKYKWVHGLYVHRFAQSLSVSNQTSGSSEETQNLNDKEDDHRRKTMINNALLASTTFVGTNILEPFFSSFHLRNYMCPYAMLVDHEGVVRWMSGGCPDAYEAAHFPGLLRQLESEYFKSNSPH